MVLKEIGVFLLVFEASRDPSLHRLGKPKDAQAWISSGRWAIVSIPF